ncbi:chemotaxis protein CheW [Marinobacter zhanjiangensis]|uniref:Chemotaxis protein CheW n=1 Tax=Marinobacter zhanjiangensis TaxID=578215 RepID=A0ABQ3AKT7_9GAMM|nr:chemotaxis protein CheW [Marinobacter zhanjiangensis]GGY59956.1 chemotaxis protein CheW [Marinobacter zhanjiangensis]
MTGKNSEAGAAQVAAAAGAEREFLTFRLGEEEYAIDILKVQEIRGYGGVTRIARAPSFIKGVINLRGTIIPIVDLRDRFGVGELTYDEFTIVIVLNLSDRVVGIVVDSVSDVMRLTEDHIRPAPDFSTAVDTRYIEGLADMDDGMVIVLEINGMMSDPGMELQNAELG